MSLVENYVENVENSASIQQPCYKLKARKIKDNNFFVESGISMNLNNEKKIFITKTRDNAIIPSRGTEGSAGLDLYAAAVEAITIKPGQLAKVPTGIAIDLQDKNLVALIFSRSGLGVKHGITLSNGVGVIDSDYRGEIFVGLCNVGNTAYEVQPGDRIAQMIIMPVPSFTLVEKEKLSETERGVGGFGSTGK